MPNAFSITLRGIEAEFNKIKTQFTKLSTAEIGKRANKMLNDFRKDTPVDTGKAQSSWHIMPTGSILMPFIITNDTEYIQYLNAGSSKQAPAFFIERIALRYGHPVGTIVKVVEAKSPRT